MEVKMFGKMILWTHVFYVVVLFGIITNVTSERVRRVAILSPPSTLLKAGGGIDTSDNDIDSLFVTKRLKFPSRGGRTLTNETSSNGKNSSALGEDKDDVESSRKASPDVQDIIDGIVKLLGGKVHPATPSGNPNSNANSNTKMNPNSNRPVQTPQPQLQNVGATQLPSSYNLFNPPKPSRINNRGPPLTDTRLPQQQLAINMQQQQHQNQHQNQHPHQQQQNLHQLPNRGQPHNHPHNHYPHQPLIENRPQFMENVHDVRGKPVSRPVIFEGSTNTNMNRDRPPIIKFQDQHPLHHHNSQNHPGTGAGFGSGSGSGERPTFEAIPLEALNGFNGNGNNNQTTRLGPPFPLPKPNIDNDSNSNGNRATYNTNSNTNYQQNNQNVPALAEAPYRKGVPLPEQLVPPKFGLNPNSNSNSNNNNNNNDNSNNGNWPKVPQPPTIPPLIPQDIPKIIQSNKNDRLPETDSNSNTSHQNQNQKNKDDYDDENENDNNNNDASNASNEKSKKEKEQDKNRQTTMKTGRPTSLLVPVPTTPTPIAIEDDEADEELENTNNNNNNVPNPINLEPSTLNTVQDSQTQVSATASLNQNQNQVQPSAVQSSYQTVQGSTNIPFGEGGEEENLYINDNDGNIGAEVQVRPTSVVDPQQNVRASSTFETSPVPVPIGISTGSTGASSTSSSSTATTTITTTSLSTVPTPPLRPGIVINDGPSHSVPPVPGLSGGYGSVEVVTADGHGLGIGAGLGGHGQLGEIFDVTVTAKQHYGGQATGQPFIIPVDLKDDLITQPNGENQFVSIDGKRQYFNLHPNTAAVVGSVTQTSSGTNLIKSSNSNPLLAGSSSPISSSSASSSSHPQLHSPIRPVTTTLTINPLPNSNTNTNTNSNSNSPKTISPINKTLPNIVRRPLTRKPAIPPVRIDTCIVGDDSTCNAEQFEVCKTENGVSSCLCRAGYARRRHREPCKAIVSMVLSIKLDKLGDKKLNYNPDYFNPDSEIYRTLELETIHAMNSAMVDTSLSSNYVGSRLDAIGFDGRHAVVNQTVLLQENPKMPNAQVKRELQRQLIQSLTRSRNNFGKSQLWVEGPISAVAAITDVNECESPELNDCDGKASCVNTFGSFECKCEAGYGDAHEKDKRLSGRKCESCNGKSYCNGRGECLIEKGQKVCKCSGNYYGSQCDIDGEVLAVAIGASISAVVIIGLTLACLCMWSRRWKKEEQKAALMSRTLFGGMATQALSYLSKNTMNSSNNPYQQHVSLDDRLRWANVDGNLNGNIYVQNEPMSMCAGPPMMDTRRSAETLDTTVDDLFDMDRHQTKRPRSRSSQMQNGGIYYDLEPQSQEMYASSPYPAQFCVPMNQYHRGFYN